MTNKLADAWAWMVHLGPGAHLYIVAVLITAGVLFFPARSILFLAVLGLPGTLAHELCHFSVGLLTNARPSWISIMPSRSADGGYRLGYVSFTNLRWYNGALTGLAPLLLFLFAFLIVRWRLGVMHGWPGEIPWVFLAATLTEAGTPSSADLRIAMETSGIVLLIVFSVLLWKLMAWGHHT